jgi:hypothetical protein
MANPVGLIVKSMDFSLKPADEPVIRAGHFLPSAASTSSLVAAAHSFFVGDD